MEEPDWLDGDGTLPCKEARSGLDESLIDFHEFYGLNLGSNIHKGFSHVGTKRHDRKSKKK